jgi:3-dehydroquinate synthase
LQSPNKLLHGEAIAIGIITESWIARKKGYITSDELNEIKTFILLIFGRIELPDDRSGIIQLTLQDKKNVGGKIQIAIPKGIGNNIWDIPVTAEEINEALEYYNAE